MDGPSRPPVATDITEGVMKISQTVHRLSRRANDLVSAHLGFGAPVENGKESQPDPKEGK